MGSRRLGPSQLSSSSKKLGSPRVCRVLSVAFPEPPMLPSLLAPRTVTHGSGPLGGCSAEAPAASSPGRQQEGLDLWEGLLGPAAHTGRIAIQINPEQEEAAKTCLNTLSVNKATRGLAEHYGVAGAAAPIFQVGKLGQRRATVTARQGQGLVGTRDFCQCRSTDLSLGCWDKEPVP